MRCPSHEAQRPWDKSEDHWRTEPNGDRTCSYCGSWHPDDLIAFLPIATDPAQKEEYINPSTKSYKLYIQRSAVKNASEGAIKFYTWHMPNDWDEATLKRLNEAIEVSFRKMVAHVDQVSIAMRMNMERRVGEGDADRST